MKQANNTELNKIGFIGVGRMGYGICLNLLARGYRLNYLAHSGNQDCQDLDRQGAIAHDDANLLARQCQVIMICVNTSTQVNAIISAPSGLIESLVPGQFIINLSTIDPDNSRALAASLQQKSCIYIDAPMTRTPREAKSGRLNVLVGGDIKDIEKIRPVLEAFCENICHTGPTGTGHAMKLLHNHVSLGFITLLCETVATARRQNIDVAQLLHVLESGGGASTALDRLKPYLREGNDTAMQFSIANTIKDLDYYRLMAESCGVDSAVSGLLRLLNNRGDAVLERPIPHLVDLLTPADK